MAILTNPSSNEYKKSIGDMTFRNVAGRIIVSKRITSNKSNTLKQQLQRNSFGILQKITKELDPVIEIGFNKPLSGMKRCSFIRYNHDLMNYLKQEDLPDYSLYPLYYLFFTLQSPLFFGNITASEGAFNVRTEFWWDNQGMPAGQVLIPDAFTRLDKISLNLCIYYDLAGNDYCILRQCAIQLFDDEIDDLEHPNFMTFGQEKYPAIRKMMNLPYGAVLKGGIMAAIVMNRSRRSTSYFQLLKDEAV